MTESKKFLDKILTYVDDNDKHWFMCHKADIKAYAKIYHKEQLNLCDVVKPLIDKKVISFDDYLEKFYIENGLNYQSKRTGKIVDIDEPKKRYDWYCKYN